MTTTHLHFCLAPSIYAAYFDTSVIILDSNADKYVSLIDDAAQSLRFILEHVFNQRSDGTYCPIEAMDNDRYDSWIAYFIEKKFIVQSAQSTPLQGPRKEGGLISYRWDHKTSWKPFAHASWWDIIQAYYMLMKVHRTMKRKGILGILTLLRSRTGNGKRNNPTHNEYQKLSTAVDAASLLYPEKTLCLAWASTFVALALRRNWNISLVVGIQTNPFYAHAWAQTADGVVINDDPLVADVLSIIVKEPYS